jgi:hypothetical protein
MVDPRPTPAASEVPGAGPRGRRAPSRHAPSRRAALPAPAALAPAVRALAAALPLAVVGPLAVLGPLAVAGPLVVALSACGEDRAAPAGPRGASGGDPSASPLGRPPASDPTGERALAMPPDPAPSVVDALARQGASVVDSLPDLDAPDPLDELPGGAGAGVRRPDEAELEPASAATLAAAAPPHGCVVTTRAPLRVFPRGGPASIVAAGDAFVVAGYARATDGSGEDVFVVRAARNAPPVPLATVRLPAGATRARPGPPGLGALDPSRVLVAASDGDGALLATTLSTSRPGVPPAWRELGRAADPRFPPAVAPTAAGAVVAYTDGSATPMRVKVVRLRPDGAPAGTSDPTPEAMGGSAPQIVSIGGTPTLFFVDARGGLSPVVRVPLGPDGAPRAAVIERPLSQLATPGRIAVAQVGGRTRVAYTAVGRAATSAIGLVTLGDTAAPEALVPGAGYGALTVAAASAVGAAVFVATRPVVGEPASGEASPGGASAAGGGEAGGSPGAGEGGTPASPTSALFRGEVIVRLLDDAGLGPELRVTREGERASHAAIARTAAGDVGVVVTTAEGVSLHLLRCSGR